MRTKFKAMMAAVAVVAALSTVGTLAPAGANAGDALVYTASVNVACFGCGATTASGSGNVSGRLAGTNYVNAAFAVNATSVNEPAATCPLQGTASGTVTIGADSGTFTWNRTGATAVVSLDVNGHHGVGTGTLVVTGPVGLPCGHAVTVRVSGTVNFTS
jgi:hypothetical protein